MAELSPNEIQEEEARNDALLQLVNERQFRTLRQELSEMNEVDVAAFIEELDPEKTVVVFRMLPKELASDVFACLELDKQQHIVSSITDKELTNIIEDLSVDDAVDMVEELPANIVKRVLQNATPETRSQINEFLKYPENSAGSIMTAEYIGLRKTMTVEELRGSMEMSSSLSKPISRQRRISMASEATVPMRVARTSGSRFFFRKSR